MLCSGHDIGHGTLYIPFFVSTLDFAIDDYEYTFSIPVIGINSTQTHTQTHTHTH